MGLEKQGSKGGNYVGGFLQMFDWNAKSRKKLFSSKSDIPEQSKQKKRCDGNLPTTRFQAMDEDEYAASIKGSSDFSCSSSLMDEDFYGSRAPGVVARLMGLDSMPKSNAHEPYSTPLFDSQSLQSSYYRSKNLDYCPDQVFEDVPFRKDVELKYKKVMQSPIKKFQTEILPPKSAKSIPITHHKLLSPIKSVNFIPSKDAAHIMEAAARIIEPSGPQTSKKTKMPSVGSSSVPLRVRDLKEKVQKTQKLLEGGGSQRKAESSGASIKNLKMNKSWNGSVDSEESSTSAKNKGKSISLALQAKANVQKRVCQKESSDRSPNQIFKSQSTTHNKNVMIKKQQNGTNVLRQNNQKQNCIVDRGKPSVTSKSTSKGVKTQSSESSTTKQRGFSSKLAGPSTKVSSRKLGSEAREEKREEKERITRKKRSIDGNYHSENIKAGSQNIRANDNVERQSNWDQDSGANGTDIVSFTFTSPMTKSGRENCKIFSSSKRTLLSPDGSSASSSRFSSVGCNVVKGGVDLSTLLEQKLKELAHKVEFSQQKTGNDMVSSLKPTMSSSMQEESEMSDCMDIDSKEELEVMSMSEGSKSDTRKLLDCRHPSPLSVLEHSSFADSWNSTDTADSNSTGGSKQCSSNHVPESLDSYSIKTYLPMEVDFELSDSASSTTSAKRWEFEYVKEILNNIEPMFEDYALGRTQAIISPHIFHQLENQKAYFNAVIPRANKRALFDCVTECMELRFRQYVNGGCELLAKGLSVVRRKEKLAEDIYKEISGWSSVGDSMIDELVDNDMSSQYGKWLNFDVEAFELGTQIEARVLNSLIDEVVADMLVL